MTISFKKIVTSLLLAVLLVVPSLASTSLVAAAGEDDDAAASASTLQNKLCSSAGSLSIDSDQTGTCSDLKEDGAEDSVNNIVSYVINIFSIIVGIVAVIMIIVGGLKYITSGGDSNKVTSAKNSIVYAIIGLIIVALAQIIVKFVLAKATQA